MENLFGKPKSAEKFGLTAVKTRYFFGETSPQTFVTTGRSFIAIVFGGTNMSFRVLNGVN